MEILLHILVAIGAIGLFLYGMKTMSEALQRFAGGSLRSALASMTLSPARGILSGTLVTGIVQSSSAVTVMIVSFVDAGLLGLPQSVAMVMGANIGTTVTGWLVALFGYGFDLGLVAVPLIGVAFPLTLVRRERLRNIGRSIVGFSLLLLAIHILKTNMESLTDDPAMIGRIAGYSGYGPWAPLLFVLAGALLTLLVQSSSAMMALTIVLLVGGLIPLECAMGMVLGENLGTTVTANLAALVTGRDAKRAALSHFLFNLFGLLWAVPLLPWLAEGMTALCGMAATRADGSQGVALALFHTLFNVANVCLLYAFIPRLVALTGRIVREGRNGDRAPVNVGRTLVAAGELSLYQARREALGLLRGQAKMLGLLRQYFRETNPEQAAGIYSGIESHRLQDERMRRNFERFSDHAFSAGEPDELYGAPRLLARLSVRNEEVSSRLLALAQAMQRRREAGVWFPQPLRERVFGLFDYTGQLFDLSVRLLAEEDILPSGETRPGHALAGKMGEYIAQSSALCAEEEVTLRAGMAFTELLGGFRELSEAAGAMAGDVLELRAGGKF